MLFCLQQALCAPSRNSFLTSRRPDTLHLYDFYSYWRNEVGNFTTLPQYLKENGYNTYSIGKIFHPGISSNWTDDYPLSWTKVPYHPSTEIYKESPVCPDKHGHRRNLVCPVHLEFQPEQTLPDLQSLDGALKIINLNENSVDPYFLAVGFHKPHIPLKYPKQYLEYHPIENVTITMNSNRPYGLPTVAWNPWIDVRNRNDIIDLNIDFPYGKMPTEWIKKIVQSYHASVTYIDDLVGKLLRKVDKNTIVVLIGDHGWSLGEHGEWSKFSNFDIATRVPFILYLPDEKPQKIYSPVELIDIFPTLIDFTSLSNIPKCNRNTKLTLCTEGKSLKSLIQKRQSTMPSFKYAFSQYPRPGINPTMQPDSDRPRLKDIKIMGYSLITDLYRYTEWIYFNNTNFQPDWNKLYGVELYGHEFDMEENINLADRPDMQLIRSKLRKILRRHNK